MAGSRGPLGKRDRIEIVPDRHAEIPPAESYWLQEIRDQWVDYWLNNVSNAADEVDKPILYRLFRYRDEHLRLQREWAVMGPDERVIEGSARVPARINPIADRLRALEADILKLEDRLGLSPLSRARLGIEVGNAQLTWDQVSKRQIDAEPKKSALPVGKVIDI